MKDLLGSSGSKYSILELITLKLFQMHHFRIGSDPGVNIFGIELAHRHGRLLPARAKINFKTSQ